MSSSSQVGHDVYICNIESKPELNGLGGRCIDYYPEKGRYLVRTHYTGRTLLLRPECVEAADAADEQNMNCLICKPEKEAFKETKKIYYFQDDEIWPAISGYVRRYPEVRRQLSLRVKAGFEEKGPGALVVNIYEANEAIPTMLNNAKDVLLSPEQTVWMSIVELTQKFQKAFTHGAGEVFGLPNELPNLCKWSSVCSRGLEFKHWDDSMAKDDDKVEWEKQLYFKNEGILHYTLGDVVHQHILRRMTGETPPLQPQNDMEHAMITRLYIRGLYDGLGDSISGFVPPGQRLAPLRDKPLWIDHDDMFGYKKSMSFVMLCFRSVPFFYEGKFPTLVDGTGWDFMGMLELGFWVPLMDHAIENATSEEEKLRMFLRDHETAKIDQAAIECTDGSFRKSLPSSAKSTTVECGNPACDKTGVKITRGSETKWRGSQLLRCARCVRENYCSAQCQRADWKRHRKVCKDTRK